MLYSLASVNGFRWFLSFFKSSLQHHWFLGILLFGAGIFQLVFDIFLPFSYELIFDRAIANKDSQFLFALLGFLTIAFIVYSFAGLAQDYLSSRIGSALLRDIRFQMLSHLQKLDIRFFNQIESGAIISHFSQDLSDIERVVIVDFPMTVYYVLLLLGSAFLLFAIEWRLAIITWAIFPLGSVGAHLFGTKATQASYNRKQDDSKILSMVQETINAQLVVKTFRLQDVILNQFRHKLNRLFISSLRSNFLSFLLGRFSLLNIVFLQLLIVGVGAYLALQGSMTVGALVGFISLLFNVNVAADGLAQQVPSLIRASSGVLRLQELFNNFPLEEDNLFKSYLPIPQREICFHNVGFSYRGEHPNLEQINLRVKIGQSVAFIGPSGSGKSTILNLLIGLYQPNKGTITIDDYSLQQVTQASLQSHLGIVFQEAFLFNTTIRENIRLGKLDATDQEIIEAAKAAEIHQVIEKFPQGYDTIVGDRGGQLSGGQRQRIAIARAILRDPAILLLDEATSALDPETEAAINETISRLAKGRTLITVTHRLTSAMNSDCIFVLDSGHLVEQGTHQELLKREGLYQRLWQKQSHPQIKNELCLDVVRFNEK